MGKRKSKEERKEEYLVAMYQENGDREFGKENTRTTKKN